MTADLTAQRLQRIEHEQQAMNERLDQLMESSTRTAEILGDMLQAARQDKVGGRLSAVVELLEELLEIRTGTSAAEAYRVDPKQPARLRLVES